MEVLDLQAYAAGSIEPVTYNPAPHTQNEGVISHWRDDPFVLPELIPGARREVPSQASSFAIWWSTPCSGLRCCPMETKSRIAIGIMKAKMP